MTEFLFTIPEAAKAIKMSESWLRKAVMRKEIAVVKIGSNTRIEVVEIQRFIEKQKAATVVKTAGVPPFLGIHEEITVSDKALKMNGKEQ